MDEDALDAAREAVAATRVWREQMRHDWGIHWEPEEVLDAAVGELLAERDRLRAVMDGIPVLVERTVRALQQTVGRDLAADPDTIRDGVTAALAAIQSEEPLDGSAAVTDE